MKLLNIEKSEDGKYLKKYNLTYENKAGKEKVYEIVSHRNIESVEDLGDKPTGVSIVAYRGNEFMLLREFRMAVNRYVYNLCAGMMENGESPVECAKRELYEETGLSIKEIYAVLPPSYVAVAISDISTYTVIAEVTGELSDHTSDNEDINACFFNRKELAGIIKTEMLGSKAQLAAYNFLVVRENCMAENGIEEFIKNGLV